MSKRVKNYIYFIFCCGILILTYGGYSNIRKTENLIKNNSPIEVQMIKVYKYAKSSSVCDVMYKDKLYKSIPYPGGIKEGEFNRDIFYYNDKEDKIIIGKVSYKLFYIALGLLLFFILLWISDIRYNKLS